MAEQDLHNVEERADGESLARQPVSRREFLKIAGAAGAAVGLGAGLGAWLAACGADGKTTTTTAAGEATATAAGETTTAATGPEAGDEIKCGYVLPVTGPLAAFGAAASWGIDYFSKNVWKEGMVLGDGKLHKVTILIEDMQSDSERAGQVAGDLIANARVTLIGASASAANVVPVRTQAETLGCPCVTCDCPGDVWNLDQPEGGFKWSWHTWFLIKDIAADFFGMWAKIPTNKAVGALFPNSSDGNAFAGGFGQAIPAAGYTYVDPGRFEEGLEDYTAVITQFKKEGVETIIGVLNPPDFSTFWKQALQQDFKPKISTQPKALLLPAGIEALGEVGAGQTVEAWFHPKFPFKSDMTGLTSQEVADRFEAEKNAQWTQPVGFFGQFEVWTDILKRATDPTDRGRIVEAIKQTKLMTVGGLVDWSVNPEPYSGWRNFSRKPVCGGQWVKGKGKYRYDLEIVCNDTDPDIPTTAGMVGIP